MLGVSVTAGVANPSENTTPESEAPPLPVIP
jgi:hypothetical protein